MSGGTKVRGLGGGGIILHIVPFPSMERNSMLVGDRWRLS